MLLLSIYLFAVAIPVLSVRRHCFFNQHYSGSHRFYSFSKLLVTHLFQIRSFLCITNSVPIRSFSFLCRSLPISSFQFRRSSILVVSTSCRSCSNPYPINSTLRLLWAFRGHRQSFHFCSVPTRVFASLRRLISRPIFSFAGLWSAFLFSSLASSGLIYSIPNRLNSLPFLVISRPLLPNFFQSFYRKTTLAGISPLTVTEILPYLKNSFQCFQVYIINKRKHVKPDINFRGDPFRGDD